MRKIGLIMKREFTSKLKNKTLIIMTFLGPVFFAGFFAFVVWMSKADRTDQKIQVIDETQLFEQRLKGNDYISFVFDHKSLAQAENDFYKTGYTSILYIPHNLIDGGAGTTKLFFKKAPGIAAQTFIKDQLEKIIYEDKLEANDIDPMVIQNAHLAIKIITERLDEQGASKETPTDFVSLFGFLIGALMFMFILIYGMMVMRSVMEEKTNRIVEIIVSSVKPFELMIGKILGIALLGLCQFIVMVTLTATLTTVLSSAFLTDIKKDVSTYQAQQEKVHKQGSDTNFKELEKVQTKLDTIELMRKIQNLDFLEIAICFVLYFLGGYLFYSSLMAAIGSAVDSEADTQQFITPVMIPLMIGYFIAVNMIMNPEGNAAIWGSMIPFTSPIVMMARLPFGVPPWQIVTSLVILIASFIGTTWLAGKIYRTGILMYGKKTSWREIGKWLFYKG